MQNGTTKTTDVLEIVDGIIKYNPPISYFYTNGTVKLKLKYDGGSSNYVTFSIPKNLISTDDIILKKDNENYLVRKSTNYKYNDLPIASTTSLGGIIVGDNLTIDSNGKLNAQSGGSAATIQVGTTTTGEPGTDAQVTNSGTSSAAVFDFVIPRGAKGEKGDTGASGQDGITPNIQVGTTTTLAAGSQATVTQRGTTANPIFDFGIPKGIDGGVTDYNNLTNKPVINLSSEDASNPIVLYNLDEGIYKLYGYIKYYPTYAGTTAITSPTLATVSKSSTTTYIQLLQPYGNEVTGYEITSASYVERKIKLDRADLFKNLFNKNDIVNGWLRYSDNVLMDVTSTTFMTSGYIEVKPNTQYTLNLVDATSLSSGGIMQYDSNFNWIQPGISETQVVMTFTTTSTTKYVRFVLRNDAKDSIQMEEDSSATKYTPFAAYIVESGSNQYGTWTKYSDGTMICSSAIKRDITFSQSGNVYTGTTNAKVYYPQEFTSMPRVISNTEWDADYYYCAVYGMIRNKISINSITFLRTTSPSNTVEIPFIYTAIGKWK